MCRTMLLTLHILSGVGFLSAAATAAFGQDRIYRYCSHRYNDNGRPEYRLIVTQFGMIVFPIGLVIWAWTAQAQTHWMGPMVGSAVFAYGLMMTFNSIQVSWFSFVSSPPKSRRLTDNFCRIGLWMPSSPIQLRRWRQRHFYVQ